MSTKLKQPLNEPTPTGYRLVKEWVYIWRIEAGADPYSPSGPEWRKIEIPAGFEYDGASVPRWLWSVTGLRPDGLIRAAALLHDYLYQNIGQAPLGSFFWADTSLGGAEDPHPNTAWHPEERSWSRKDTDRMFARIMREAGVSKTKRRLAYIGVRIGGWFSWLKHSRRVRNHDDG